MTEASIPPNSPPALPPTPAPSPSAGGPPRASIKRLYRDPYGMIGGVASGMAGYFGVDPVLVRLLWLIALVSGIGFFAYLLFWVIVPKAPVWPAPGYPETLPDGSKPTDIGGAMVAGLIVVTLAAIIGSQVGGLGDFVLPAALIGFGIYLLNQRPQSAETVAGSATALGATLPASDTPRATELDQPAAIVTPLVLSVLALGGGIAWALHSFGVIALSFTVLAAGALIVVGAGLIASLWLGRARGLVPLGIGLGAVLLVASAAEPWFEASRGQAMSYAFNPSSLDIGEREHHVTTLAELKDEYELGMGELKLDFGQLDLAGTTEHVRVHVGVGELTLIVPRDVAVEVKGGVGVGEASVLGETHEGLGRRFHKIEQGSAEGKLVIDLEIGIGEGTVRREG